MTLDFMIESACECPKENRQSGKGWICIITVPASFVLRPVSMHAH
jgi:hypothetical protein